MVSTAVVDVHDAAELAQAIKENASTIEVVGTITGSPMITLRSPAKIADVEKYYRSVLTGPGWKLVKQSTDRSGLADQPTRNPRRFPARPSGPPAADDAGAVLGPILLLRSRCHGGSP